MWSGRKESVKAITIVIDCMLTFGSSRYSANADCERLIWYNAKVTIKSKKNTESDIEWKFKRNKFFETTFKGVVALNITIKYNVTRFLILYRRRKKLDKIRNILDTKNVLMQFLIKKKREHI